jgi:hypothetical protein
MIVTGGLPHQPNTPFDFWRNKNLYINYYERSESSNLLSPLYLPSLISCAFTLTPFQEMLHESAQQHTLITTTSAPPLLCCDLSRQAYFSHRSLSSLLEGHSSHFAHSLLEDHFLNFFFDLTSLLIPKAGSFNKAETDRWRYLAILGRKHICGSSSEDSLTATLQSLTPTHTIIFMRACCKWRLKTELAVVQQVHTFLLI